VTVIVGETGRAGRSRAPAKRAPKAAAGAAGEVGEPQELPATSGQWSWRWAAEGPGPLQQGCDGEPDLTLALSPEDARLVAQGLLPPSVAFMQGRLKTSGDNGLLLSVLAWTATPAAGPELAKLAGG